MCLDPTGRKLLKLLWGVKVLKRTHTVPYADLEKALSDLMRDADPNDVKEIDIKCLKAILCDPFDDNVELQRCCQVINWFGPIKPYNQFFQNLRSLVILPGFFGFLSSAKGTELVEEYHAEVKGKFCVYLYRFSNTDFGSFVLTFMDKEGEIQHKKIERTGQGLVCADNSNERMQFSDFTKLHKTFKKNFKIKKPVPGSPYAMLQK
eukprot:TRINITY_DN4216_c0_g1_i4.p2 TRINITY_DN4216_c0_g1~~TRINITY_DN4216_c0_g1_i4.p2  ORF type:complete len:206 (+),score=46.20 TRINITY_DN4216_c0_g1_i4:1650-2267(+)